MDEITRKKCDEIKDFIYNGLEEYLDETVFMATSFESLGKIYYDYILQSVHEATDELVKIVIKALSVGEQSFEQDQMYFTELCKIIDISILPSEKINFVESKFDEVFVQKRSLITQKYQSEMANIQNQLCQTKRNSDAIKNAPKTMSCLRDISAQELQLYDLASLSNQLRTRKEALTFSFKYAETRLFEFCDLNNTDSITYAIRRKTLDICKCLEVDENRIFDTYEHSLEFLEDDINRDYMLFFKIKIYVAIEKANKLYHFWTYNKSIEEALESYKEYISKIPAIDDLHTWKTEDDVQYNQALDQLIADYDLFNYLCELLEDSVCFRERKATLKRAIELFEQSDFVMFNIIIPVQIEGMFADFLKDTTTFSRFTNMTIFESALLQEKIRLLNETTSPLYQEATEYFMYHFNNLIRNRIAHGRYKGDDEKQIVDEIFAKELLLDLCLLVHMGSRLAETEKMYRFLHGYVEHYQKVIQGEHPCFGALFNDLIGQKIISEYDGIERYRPMKIVYWIVNPYYEKIYERIGDKNELLALRQELYSDDFWKFVLNRLDSVIAQGFDYLDIHSDFYAIVKGMFNCIESSETKKILGMVNAKLQHIKKL